MNAFVAPTLPAIGTLSSASALAWRREKAPRAYPYDGRSRRTPVKAGYQSPPTNENYNMEMEYS